MARAPGDIVQIADINEVVVNPATFEKQEEMVAELANITNAVLEKRSIRLEEASSTLTYVGKAAPGELESSASWQIFVIDTSSGTAVKWAGGTSDFTNVWDDRASYTYS